MTAASVSAAPDRGELIPAVDWQGAPLDCARCPNRSLLEAGHCVPLHACVFDRYARRIDRFFRWNRGACNDYLDHPYFEVRAIACKHADLFRLTKLIDDPDETVRLSVALRLPQRLLLRLRDDPHREVRIRVAQRLEPAALGAMMVDPDYYVRVLVPGRVPTALLPLMLADPDREVRAEVAARIGMPALLRLADDSEVAVPPALLDRMLGDEAWQVRWELTQRAGPALLTRLARDPDPEVSREARQRLALHIDHGEERHG